MYKKTKASLFSLGLLSLLTGCSSFVDDPTKPDSPPQTSQPPVAPQPPPQQTPPEVKPPNPNPDRKPKAEEAEHQWYLCDYDRRHLLARREIDDDQFRICRRKNFGPIYNTPGNRDSGATTWVECRQSLIINGFIQEPNDPPITPSLVSHQPNNTDDLQRAINLWCEEARILAYLQGHIDIGQFYYFRRRNFATAYDIPGDPTSEISWVRCEDAIRLNEGTPINPTFL